MLSCSSNPDLEKSSKLPQEALSWMTICCTKTRPLESCQITTNKCFFIWFDKKHVTWKNISSLISSSLRKFPLIKKKCIFFIVTLICCYFVLTISANPKKIKERRSHCSPFFSGLFKCMKLFHGSMPIFWSDSRCVSQKTWIDKRGWWLPPTYLVRPKFGGMFSDEILQIFWTGTWLRTILVRHYFNWILENQYR